MRGPIRRDRTQYYTMGAFAAPAPSAKSFLQEARQLGLPKANVGAMAAIGAVPAAECRYNSGQDKQRPVDGRALTQLLAGVTFVLGGGGVEMLFGNNL